MTDKDKEDIKSAILSDIDSLKIEIAELKELTKPIPPDVAIGRLTRMDAINNKSVNEAALRSATAKMNKLNTSLSRLDTDDFGKCWKCSEPIPIERIKAIPESTACLKCAVI